MIRSISKIHSSKKISSKKPVQSKLTKAASKNELKQQIKEKYLFQTFEDNIKSLKVQMSKLQDTIFQLRRANSMKKIKLYSQKQFLKEKEIKINKKQIAIFPYSGDYHKYMNENDKAKRENSILFEEIERLKQQLSNLNDELEDINNKNHFNCNDTFEVVQLEAYDVEYLQSKIRVLRTNCSCSHQKIDEYRQMMREYTKKENEIQKQIDEENDKLFKFREIMTVHKIQTEIDNFDMEPQSVFVDFLESEVKNLDDVFNSANESIQNEVKVARCDYEQFIAEIDAKKGHIFTAIRNILKEKQIQSPTECQISFSKKKEKCNDNELFLIEEDINEYQKIVEKINGQLSKRSEIIKDQNIHAQTKQIKYSTARSKIEGCLKAKIMQIDFLKNQYQTIQDINTEILFQRNKVNDLKEKTLKLNDLLNDASFKKRDDNLANKHIKENIKKNHIREKEIEQKEKELFNQEDDLNKKNNLLLQKSNRVNLFEQQIQIKEKDVLRIEHEAQMLKDQLSSQMKLLESKLLAIPFREKMGITA